MTGYEEKQDRNSERSEVGSTSNRSHEYSEGCGSPVSVVAEPKSRRPQLLLRQSSLRQVLKTPIKMAGKKLSKAVMASAQGMRDRKGLSTEDLKSIRTPALLDNQTTYTSSQCSFLTSQSSFQTTASPTERSEEFSMLNYACSTAQEPETPSRRRRIGATRRNSLSRRMSLSNKEHNQSSVSKRLSSSTNDHCLRRCKSDDLRKNCSAKERPSKSKLPRSKTSASLSSKNSRLSRNSGSSSKLSSSRRGHSVTRSGDASKPRRSRGTSVGVEGRSSRGRSESKEAGGANFPRGRSASVGVRKSARGRSVSTAKRSSPITITPPNSAPTMEPAPKPVPIPTPPLSDAIDGKWQCSENEDRFSFCVGCGLRKTQALKL